MKTFERITILLCVIACLPFSCGNPLLELIEEDIESYEQSRIPVIETFLRTGAEYVNTLSVDWTLKASTSSNDIVARCVKTDTAVPDPTDNQFWTDYNGSELNGSTPLTDTVDGPQNIYAWVKDSSGTISARSDISVTLDRTLPQITGFTLTSADPTDNPDITFILQGSEDIARWCVKENATPPEAGSSEWVTTKPTAYTLSDGDGLKTVYAWAIDTAGNISGYQTVSVTLDMTSPLITQFTLTSPDPTHNDGITFNLQGSANIIKWCVNESDTAPVPASTDWLDTKPSGYTLSSGDGAKTVYAWGMDAENTTNAATYFSVTLDTEAPVINTFSLTSDNPTDQRAITFTLAGSADIEEWFVKENDDATPTVGSASWLGEKPTGYTITGSLDTTHTIYAFAKDGADNISSYNSFTVELVTTPSASYGGDTGIVGHEAIVVTFSTDMDTGTVAVTGDMGSDGNSKDWGGTTDTLTITPTTHWTVGAGKTLVINGNSTGGIAMEEFSESFDIAARVHVTTTGDDNPAYGTASNPCVTIQYALDMAAGLYETADVLVASGTYEIDGRTGTGSPVEMKPGISLYGGYSSADWTTRDTAGQPSILEDTSTDPGTGPLKNIVVSFPSTAPRIGNGTILDGFTLKTGTNSGSNSDYIAALSCEGADPTISDVTIEGRVGSNTTVSLFGLHIANDDDSAPVIDDCSVFETWTGDPCDCSCALYNYGSGNMTAQYSTLCGGRAVTWTRGILSFSTDTITECTVESGRAVGGTSCGIYAYAGSTSISGCDIHVGDTTAGVFEMSDGYGIMAGSGGSTPAIDDNTFTWTPGTITSGGVCYAIWEAGASDDPTSVSDNSFDTDFVGSTDYGYYRDEGSTRIADMTTALSGPDGTLASFGNNTFDD